MVGNGSSLEVGSKLVELALRTPDIFRDFFFFVFVPLDLSALALSTSALDGGLLAEGDVGRDLEETDDLETEGNKMEAVLVGDPGDRVGDLPKTTDWDRPRITATAVDGLRLALVVDKDLTMVVFPPFPDVGPLPFPDEADSELACFLPLGV